MIKSIPNILTISRIIVIPLIIGSFYIEKSLVSWVAASLFVLASITDFLDGYLARAWSVQSSFGRFLDPIADKLLVVSVILMLVYSDTIVGWQIFPAIAIVCREILVSGLREFLAELNVSIPVSRLGKIKTAFQMLALFALLLVIGNEDMQYATIIGEVAIWIAAILTTITGYAYLQAGLKHMPST